MDGEDRDLDRKLKLCGQKSGVSKVITLDQIKSLYIASGMSVQEIAETSLISEDHIQSLVNKHKLVSLREAYVREGLNKIQNKQITQAQQLLDLEVSFKKMRIIQLEDQLKDFMAYFARHGDFYKRHPLTGEILVNNNKIPLQISIPNITKEVLQLKESVTLSEGMKNLLSQIDQILNNPKPCEPVDNTTIDITKLEGIFEAIDD